MRYLREHLQPEVAAGAALTGSSAGALACILAACDVDPAAALSRAAGLCHERAVLSRPWGLAGVWGGLVADWLRELLPEDAAERCRAAGVGVAVTRLPLMETVLIRDFKDKDDVIDVAMASVHIPFFMDGRPWAACRGTHLCIDGSFLYILLGRTKGLLPEQPALPAAAAATTAAVAAGRGAVPAARAGPAVILFDPWRDEELRRRWSLRQCLGLLGPAGAEKLLEAGHDYARRLDAAGGLATLRAVCGAATPPAAAAAAARSGSHAGGGYMGEREGEGGGEGVVGSLAPSLASAGSTPCDLICDVALGAEPADPAWGTPKEPRSATHNTVAAAAVVAAAGGGV